MRITFQIRYHTEYGQSIWLTGNHPLFGDDQPENALPLQYSSHEYWRMILELPADAVPDASIAYRYILRQKDGSTIEDWGQDRIINPSTFHSDEVQIIDSWIDPGLPQNVFCTAPFREVLLKRNVTAPPAAAPARITHRFKVSAPLLSASATLCLLGSSPCLGQWNNRAPLLLNYIERENSFVLDLDLSQHSFPAFYKYGVYDLSRKEFVRFEEGENRTLPEPTAAGQLAIVNDGFAALPEPSWKGAGVAIPVFSLRTESSFGIGEFSDLKRLVDWCRAVGLKLIQILPANDTTATNSWRDSYPYCAISAFALHPLYVNVSRVADPSNQTLVAEAEPERLRLNALGAVDYESVLKAKLALLRKLYAAQHQKTFRTRAYRKFFSENKQWLEPYALFCHLRDEYGTADFNQWPAFRHYDAGAIAALSEQEPSAASALGFYYFVQFHLHVQLREAVEYAHANGVVLKGDIAIGVYRHGVDAWQAPEQYHMETQAGAPPDPFSDKGQNWSFPTYNWPRMQANGYAWWKQRFEQMGRYFDAFRIDHVLGFFRIWSIPLHAVEGILGYFAPALPVQLAEFGARGIGFVRDRYVKPFINEAVLDEIFGPAGDEVKRRFLSPAQEGRFELKPEFSTQRQVESHFAGQEVNDSNQRLKLGLYDLISNVILLEPDGSSGRQFHFRFAIENTSSFCHLDPETQGRLKELYVDYFFRRQEEFWRKSGLQKLPALKRATNLLVCGEDLGMVPACVPEVMKQLGLLSLEVQRMPKRLNQQFSRPKDAPYLSVVTPSTHDMSTLRAWWQEDPNVTQRFFNQELGEPGIAPAQCEPWINKAIALQHLASPAMWSIFQLQDLLGMDAALRRPNPDEERINVPADPAHYWRYRMHLTLETLLASVEFNRELRQLIAENGRSLVD